MDSKTKKIVLIASMVLIIITAIALFYSVNITKDFEFKTGEYFCKMEIINEGNTNIYKWDIGIANNNTKNGIIENVSNRESLEKFRGTVGGITKKRFEVFLVILYLTFILIVFASVQKDSQILKNESYKKIFQLFNTLLIIFLIYKISISFFELNGLYKDINFYFSLLS
ncbi:MAG TPA: hypothetical protein VIK86_01085 [Candidatus Paceibacterota bacterium]